VTQSAGHDFVVIGGGMAGASALAEMSRHGRALLVEAESQTGYHSTGRSAAILAQTYGNGVVQALTRASEPFLTAPPKGFSDAPLLTPRTLIRIARPDQEPELRGMFDGLEDTGLLRWLDAEEIARRVPIIRPGYASGGFLNADAQDMDVHAMLQGYLRTARVNGAEVLTGAPVTALDRTPGGWRVEAGGRRLDAGCIINAAGAWADRVAALAGLWKKQRPPMWNSRINSSRRTMASSVSLIKAAGIKSWPTCSSRVVWRSMCSTGRVSGIGSGFFAVVGGVTNF